LQMDTSPVDVAVSLDDKWVFVLNDRGEVLVFSRDGRLKEKIQAGRHVDQTKVGPRDNLAISPYTAHRRKVKILDIGEGGCAFLYDGAKEELAESGFLSLAVDDTPFLDSVDFVTTSDSPLPTTENNSTPLRRRSDNHGKAVWQSLPECR
jgi:hypothetical protein